MFVTLRGQLDSLPTNMEYVVCGQAAAKLLGLTTIKPPLSIYSSVYIYPDLAIENIILENFDDIDIVKVRGGIRCTSVEQTIIDLLKKEGQCDPQVIPECIAMLLTCDNRNDTLIANIETLVIENGLADRYSKYKENAEDFWRC